MQKVDTFDFSFLLSFPSYNSFFQRQRICGSHAFPSLPPSLPPSFPPSLPACLPFRTLSTSLRRRKEGREGGREGGRGGKKRERSVIVFVCTYILPSKRDRRKPRKCDLLREGKKKREQILRGRKERSEKNIERRRRSKKMKTSSLYFLF